MRRTVALGCGVVCAVAALCVPGASLGQTPGQDSVTGSGSARDFTEITVDVRSGSSGENPSGEVTATNGFDTFIVSVDCLVVDGNTATFAGIARSQLGTELPVTVTIRDNGPVGDTFTFVVGSASCGSPLPAGPDDALRSGDFVVVDAPPAPTAKEQCKDSGWQQYGFRNQGQCIKSVNSDN